MPSNWNLMDTFRIVYLAPLSAILSFILMFNICVAQKFKTTGIKRDHMSSIFWMSFCDFGLSLRFCIPLFKDLQDGSIYCWVSAISGVFFTMGTCSWYFIISLQTFVLIWYKAMPQCVRDAPNFAYHMYVWLISIAVTIIPINTYGLLHDTGTCWIRNPRAYRLIVSLPETIYMCFAIGILCYLFYTLYSRKIQQKKSILLRTVVFVGVYAITWFLAWMFDFFVVFSVRTPSWLKFIAPLFISSSGVFNFIVWTFILQKRQETYDNVLHNPLLNKQVQKSTSQQKSEWDMKTTDLLSEVTSSDFISDPFDIISD